MFGLKQKGLSPFGVLFVMIMVVGSAMFAVNTGPYYLDYNSIRSTFKSVAQMPDATKRTNSQIEDSIQKQLAINSIRDFRFDDSAYFFEEDGEKAIGFEYEIRTGLFGNIDLILSFKYETEIK